MHRSALIFGCLLAFAVAGCGARSSEAPPPAEEAAKPIPPDSPLAKIKVGMTEFEVSNILGPPTSQGSYETGKRWIPYYYGSDIRLMEWTYKGMGRVIFTGGNVFGGNAGKVKRVDYDPSETGVR
jgi:hypothetical protein